VYTRYLDLAYARSGVPVNFNGEWIRLSRAALPYAGTKKQDLNAKSWELEIFRAILDELRPDDRIADVGANIGLYAIVVARHLTSGRVYAFEPDPVNAALLRRHLALNGVADRVEVIQAAAGEASGSASFVAAGSTLSSMVGTRWDDPDLEVVTVPTVTLDEALPSGADILKIDTEGYEGHVLAGAAVLLSDPNRRPRLLVVEVHPEAMPEPQEEDAEPLRAWLADRGYEIGERIAALFGQEHWILRPGKGG
jgi:FkbM family methyltransferase